ncbi:IclR family transcriptional regulator [bacterium]|nr:IclR family transcriptional regulator [bacterium]
MILEILGKRKMGFSELYRILLIPKATLHRILKILIDTGMVRYIKEERKYHLGYKILSLASEILNNLPLREIANSYMKQLCEKTKETVELAIPDGKAILYIDKRESSESIRLFAQIGSRYETIHASAPGKIILAFSEDKEILEKIPLKKITDYTITDISELRREIEKIRKRGWAFDNQEARVGVRRIAAPIFDFKGNLAGIIGIAGPSFRIKKEKIKKFGELVKNIAESISKELGYTKKEGVKW